jgi:Ca2+-binding RTX toxin-like protein
MRGVIHKTLGVAAGLLLLAPASALAGQASQDPGGIARYQGFANEANNVLVGELPGPSATTKTVVFTDVAVPITTAANSNCIRPNPNTSHVVHCFVPAGTTLVRVALEDENDRLQPDPVNPPRTIRFSSEGDTGNDIMIGTVNRDVLDGESGIDDINARAGNDAVQGGSGDDDLDGSVGDDTVDGAGGNDDVRGGLGRDTLIGAGGSDNLHADDNAPGDSADCGETLFDNDFVRYNAGDLIANCERQLQD